MCDIPSVTSSQIGQPVDRVLWVPIDMVTLSDYDPNNVAKVEMRLLYTSIRSAGYTETVENIWDPAKGKYVIVDGFHRNYTMRTNKEIFDRCHGLLPIVVIDRPINDRIASTVRHNRARGKHSVQWMPRIHTTGCPVARRRETGTDIPFDCARRSLTLDPAHGALKDTG